MSVYWTTLPDVRLDIVARGFWERQRSAFFDVRICHPNADSYRDMDVNQIYRQHETEKKRQYQGSKLRPIRSHLRLNFSYLRLEKRE